MPSLTFHFPDRDPITVTPSPWAHVWGSIGVHWFGRSLRISNGVANAGLAGVATLKRIDIELDEPMEPTFKHRCVIGTGRSWTIQVPDDLICLPPRASWTLDFGPVPELPPDPCFRLGDITIPYPEALKGKYAHGASWADALRTGTAPAGDAEMQGPMLGLFSPLGNRVSNEGGGNQIAPMPHAPDASTVLLRHRLTAQRMWTDCLDRTTGEPLAAVPDANYSLEGTITRNATLAAFHESADGKPPWESNAVKPRRLSAKQAAHEAALIGSLLTTDTGWMTWAGGWQTHDGQHAWRFTAPALACAQLLDDPVARFDLRMHAQNMLYAHRTVPAGVRNNGSTYYGIREVVNLRYALLAASEVGLLKFGETTFVLASTAQAEMRERARKLCAASIISQMPNGCTMRYPWVQHQWGFNPSPWTASGAVPKPLPITRHVCAGMENAFEGLINCVTQQSRRAAYRTLMQIYVGPNSIVRRKGYRPKWLAVAHDKAPSFLSPATHQLHPNVVEAEGGPDVFDRPFLGFAYWAGYRKEAIEALMLLHWGDKGRPSSPEQALQWMTEGSSEAWTQRYQTPCVVAALEDWIQ